MGWGGGEGSFALTFGLGAVAGLLCKCVNKNVGLSLLKCHRCLLELAHFIVRRRVALARGASHCDRRSVTVDQLRRELRARPLAQNNQIESSRASNFGGINLLLLLFIVTVIQDVYSYTRCFKYDRDKL